MNKLQQLSLSILMAACTWLSPGYASAGEDIVVDAAPPPPRVERQPPHRDGYVWAPGHWEWNGRFFSWASGTWIAERPGHWIASRWDLIGNQWHYVQGHWER